jgi:hypothetical protein
MPFGFGKLNTLEAKLVIYEDLSKEMLDKLERAVSSIQDNSNKVAIILERHENRLDEGDKANDAIIKLISRVEKQVEGLQIKVEDNQRTVWKVSWGALVIIGAIQLLPLLGLTIRPANDKMSVAAADHWTTLRTNTSDSSVADWRSLST